MKRDIYNVTKDLYSK